MPSQDPVAAEGLAPSPRRVARMGAVQALYQIDLTGMAPDKVLLEFLEHRLEEDLDGLRLSDLDRQLFTELVRGVTTEAGSLDDMLSALLAQDWPIERLERLLKTVLRAGAYELSNRPQVPARAVVSEYVDLAHAFFTGKEPGMANGILDRLARALRPEEFDGEGGLDGIAGAG